MDGLPRPVSEYRPLDFEDEMPFGKHKWTTVADVIDDDPQYMVWLLSEGRCNFTPEVEREINKYVK